MAKKEFTADSGLGFMRVIQVVNVLNVISYLFVLLFVNGSRMPIDFILISITVNLVGQSVIVWMIAKRKIYTRQVVIVFQIVIYINWLIPDFIAGTLNVASAIGEAIVPALLCVYFLTSRRAKAVLVQPFDVRVKDKDLDDQTKMWNPRSVDFWLRLLIYFFCFSVMGHWMEMGVQILVINGLFPGTVASADSLTWRDNLNPFFIYGIAVVICGAVLFPIYVKLKQVIPNIWVAFLVSFLINMAFCVAAELVLGFLFNTDYSAWDYRDQFMNFQGQICLVYSVAFGIASSVITWLVYPFLEKQFSYIGKDLFRVIFVASAVIFAMLYVTYNVDLARLGAINENAEQNITNILREGSSQEDSTGIITTGGENTN